MSKWENPKSAVRQSSCQISKDFYGEISKVYLLILKKIKYLHINYFLLKIMIKIKDKIIII